MKIGFIGCGNMGGALISGIIKTKLCGPDDVLAYDIDKKKLAALAAEQGIRPVDDIKALCAESDLIVMAVKPQDIENLLKANSAVMDSPAKVVISIAAGVKTSLIRSYIKQAAFARVMPNTPALVGKGATAVYFDGAFTDIQRQNAMNIFASCGIVEIVQKEALLDAVTGLSGSGPAYVYAFINSLADGGVKEGLPRDVARRLAAQTVLGTAELALTGLADGTHLEELKDRVTSPGGTTAAGLFALEQSAFRASVIGAVKAAADKSRELGK